MAEELVEDPVAVEIHRALEKARQDAKHAPPAWVPVFAVLANRLLDGALRMESLRRRHGIQSRQDSDEFRAVYGRGPAAYVTRLRVETGRRLLLTTDLDAWRIAPLVGFSSLSGFEKAYLRTYGEPPSAVRASRKAAPTSAERTSRPDLDDDIAQLFALAMTAAEADAAITKLRHRAARPHPGPALTRRDLEKLVAARLWRHVRERPPGEWSPRLGTSWFQALAPRPGEKGERFRLPPPLSAGAPSAVRPDTRPGREEKPRWPRIP